MMTFSDSVKSCLSNYMNWSGRASRSEYWWFLLFINSLLAIAVFIDVVMTFLLGFNLLLSLTVSLSLLPVSYTHLTLPTKA